MEPVAFFLQPKSVEYPVQQHALLIQWQPAGHGSFLEKCNMSGMKHIIDPQYKYFLVLANHANRRSAKLITVRNELHERVEDRFEDYFCIFNNLAE